MREGALDPEAKAKYLNGPETSLFHKGTMLYGLAEARRWGEAFYGAGAFAVLRITVTRAAAGAFVHWDRRDGIGPACFATIEQLDGAADRLLERLIANQP